MEDTHDFDWGVRFRQSVKFSGNVIELEKQARGVEENPTAPGGAEKLDRALQEVAERETEAAPEKRLAFRKARAARDLARIGESAKSQKESPEELRTKLAALQSSSGSLLKAESYRKVADTIRPTLPPPEPQKSDAISQATRAYLSAMDAYNARANSKYDQAFTHPLECFYGNKNVEIEDKRAHSGRTTTLKVSASDLTKAAKLADDTVRFCDAGSYQIPGAAQRKHEKLIIMRKQDSAWLIAVEDFAMNPRCAGVPGVEPCT